ncbi:MAG: efflux RND transporter periplasmic adaptor subunit [Proteobacteria bacterium]|nr:MAG: efflux RND transporter periplasmic adaptor subunit [Pseudomonadota bacterium]
MTTDKTPRRLTYLAALTLALVAGGGLVYANRSDSAEAAPAVRAEAAIPVSIQTVEERHIQLWQEFSGRLEAVDEVDIRSRVSGTILAVHFKEGSLVKAGDLLITIDPAPYAAEVDRASAQVVAARARMAYSASEAERAERLWKVKAVAKRELDERVNAQREAEAQLQAALAALKAAKLNLDYTQVRAPVSGRVGRMEITVGNLVAAGPGAPVLTRLVSVNPIYARFDADEAAIAQVLRSRQRTDGVAGLKDIPVQMSTLTTGDRVLTGHLQLVDNQVDAGSGTVRMRAVFDSPDGLLLPGQFARVRLGSEQPAAAVLISERAVGTDQDKKFVLVVDDEDRTRYREVQLGNSVDGERVVLSGLSAGERVVVSGLQRVRQGSLVAPQAPDTPAPTAGL